MDVFLHDKNTQKPVEQAQMFYTDANGDAFLVYTPEISNADGLIGYDQSISRFVRIEHPHFKMKYYEFPETQTEQRIIELEPLMGVQPGEKQPDTIKKFIQESMKNSPVMTVAVFALMGAAAWWLLTSK